MPDSGYYANERGDVIDALPRPLGRVFDVGTGQGGTARGLRAAGATEIVGVEVMPEPAARAAEVLDRVITGTVEDALEEDLGTFDTVLCLDVLEHLVDPEAVLARLRAVTRPGGTLFVSVPNARHFSLWRDVLIRGTWGSTDWGHRDRTHLRWFTPADIRATIAGAGWAVDETRWPPLGRSAALHRATGGRSSEFLVAQVYVRAHNPA
jgi:2-polyprenyl-3-methyl-5-hydroxy-6-metoxy-1,4-benzoquinol methylase